MKLNKRFGNSLKLVASNDGVYVYRRQLNQNAMYFLMVGSTITNVGGRKHIMEKFYNIRPAKGNAYFHG
jgi:hypothetical protein